MESRSISCYKYHLSVLQFPSQCEITLLRAIFAQQLEILILALNKYRLNFQLLENREKCYLWQSNLLVCGPTYFRRLEQYLYKNNRAHFSNKDQKQGKFYTNSSNNLLYKTQPTGDQHQIELYLFLSNKNRLQYVTGRKFEWQRNQYWKHCSVGITCD